MEHAKITKTIDNLGRVLIPKDVRKQAGLTSDDELEITVEKGRIILEKKAHRCVICTSGSQLIPIIVNEKKEHICTKCKTELQQIENE